MSTFNNFVNGVTIRGIPIQQTNPGAIRWVNNSTTLPAGGIAGSNGNNGTYLKPYSTILYATSQCAVGDIICVMPRHSETLSEATALSSQSGVAIVGLGKGAARPKFIIDTADTATLTLNVANVSISNFIFSANFADITAAITTSAATNFTVENCYFTQQATAMNFLNVLDTGGTSNNTDGLSMTNNTWIEMDTATLGFVKMDGTNDDITLSNNKLVLGVNNNKASLMAIATTKIVTSLTCEANRVYRLNTDTATGAILITTDVSTNTGIIVNNYIQHADVAAELIVTASSNFGFFDNKMSGVAGASGYLLPAADS